MNWDALGSISEAIGVLGVIASLVYLGQQMRHSTQATQAATLDQITGRFIEWMSSNATSTEHRKYYFTGLEGLRGANDDEVLHFYGSIQILYKIMEEVNYQRSKGLIDDEIWIGWNNWFANMKSYEAVRYFFDLKKNNMSPSFREYWAGLEEKPENNLLSIVRSLRTAKPE